MHGFWSLYDLVKLLTGCKSPHNKLHRFASVTVNLGPTFLSGALAANADTVMEEPSCPLVQVS